jgi:hypothetical protein
MSNGIWTIRDAERLIRDNLWPSIPKAPSNVVLASKVGKISISWVINNGASPVTNHIIEYTAAGGSAQTILTNNSSNSYDLQGLTNGTTYSIRVATINEIGTGPWSSYNTESPRVGIQGHLYGKFKRGERPSDAQMLSGDVLPTPLSSPSLYSSINYGENDDNYGFIAIGYFVPPTTGTYTFYTSSDDGSAVWIGSIAEASTGRSSNNMVVNNNVTGYQGDTERSGSINLNAGQVYAIRIIHREGDGGDNLTFSWAGPGIGKTISLSTYFYANNFNS